MLDVCLLGTGGTMPLPERALTALIVRYRGRNMLIDCGEGTQVMIRKAGFSLSKIDTILITHFHADHVSGLPGLLLSIGKSERTEPLNIIGGKGITSLVKSLCVIAPELPFELQIEEIDGTHTELSVIGLKVNAFMLNHSVPCYGYNVVLERSGVFLPKKAMELNIDKIFWGVLQRGEAVNIDGKLFLPNQVLGEPRCGIQITYCTDTRPTESIVQYAKNSDLFICEGMYAESEKISKAISHHHMMFDEAAKIAKAANVKMLWLTHFSPSLKAPAEFISMAQDIFENTIIPHDLQSVELNFSK